MLDHEAGEAAKSQVPGGLELSSRGYRSCGAAGQAMLFSSRGSTGRALRLEKISCMEGDLEEEGDLTQGGQSAAGRSQAAVTTQAEEMGWRRRGHWGGVRSTGSWLPGLCALSSLFLLTPLHWASWGEGVGFSLAWERQGTGAGSPSAFSTCIYDRTLS